MKPRFQEGEEVILQSKEFPDLNGEYTVEKILQKWEVTKCHKTGITYMNEHSDTYILTGLTDIAEMYYNDGSRYNVEVETPWDGSALRKKHRPADDSFQEMISKLKRPQKLSQ